MDEIDRPAEDQEPSPRAPFDKSNYPAPNNDMEEAFDEVDRPSAVKMEPAHIEEEIKPESSENGDKTIKDQKINDKKLKLDTTREIDHDFVVIDTPAAFGENDEWIDAPPSSDTDGPFSTFFNKQNPLIQRGFEKTDKEGIVSKHTTYYPRQPDKNQEKITHSDYYYDMSTFPRGKLTLINVKFFQRSSGMGDYPREGTNKDAEGLCSLFLDFGFIVDRYDNPTKQEIMKILKGAANADYSKLSCCACSILSHGEEGIIYGTDGYVKIKDITKLFRARGLAGIPKLFLFQACLGSDYMDPLDSVDGPAGPAEEREIALTLPTEADFLYAYSTVPGYYSWRNSKRGSWFMEAIVSVFREYAHKMDVVRMLTRVNAVIAHRKSRTDDFRTDNKRQIASIVTQMRKDFFLASPYGQLSNPNPPPKFV